MRITIGADHAGFEMKEYLRQYLTEQGHMVEDAGCYDLNMVDYPDQAATVGHTVTAGRAERGVLVCGTGLGMSIAANKVDGVRAARVTDPMSARLAREHNDANVLCLGAWMVGTKLAEAIINAWLSACYAEGRHGPRLEKIANLEKGG